MVWCGVTMDSDLLLDLFCSSYRTDACRARYILCKSGEFGGSGMFDKSRVFQAGLR